MHLKLQTKIEAELKSILRKAIDSGEIDVTKLRMVVVSSDSSYEKLDVCISNNWTSSFSKNYTTIIGKIDISEWLDVADQGLDMLQDLDESYIERAKEIEKKHLTVQPAITFQHLNTLETYHAFLVCLRENILSQIEAAITKVATSSTTDFEKVVAFCTHKLTYDLDYDVLLHAFNNPTGSGPLHRTILLLPDYKRSEPYLQFLETGIQLFFVQGTMLDEDTNETEVCYYDIADIAFVYFEENKIHFRLNDEFQNWTLEYPSSEAKEGELTEEQFLSAYKQFIARFPDKAFDPNNIPNPITEKEHFKKWFDVVIEYNLKVNYGHLEKIYNHGLDAYTYYLQAVLSINERYESALVFLASKLFYAEQFQESLNLYQKAVKLSNFEKIECLCSMFFLNQKEAYTNYRSAIESKSEQIKLELIDTLWLLREPLDEYALKEIEEKIIPLLETYKHSNTLYLVSVVCIKLYTLLNDKDNTLLHIQSVPTYDTFEKILFVQELQHVDYIIEAFKERQKKDELKTAFDKHVEIHSLDTSKDKKGDVEKTSYEHSYYLKNRIHTNFTMWAYPLNADTFIAAREEDGSALIVAKITSEESDEVLHQIEFPSTSKEKSCMYLNGVVYVADEEQGITTYKVSEQSIDLGTIIYRNKKVKANYETSTIYNGYIFASNNNYLEIFELNNPDAEVLSDSLYIQNGQHLFVHNNLLVVATGTGLVILVDITDKTNPFCLSTIQEDTTPSSMYISFIDNYMISRSVYDISNPAAPKWIRYVGTDLAPTYFFAPQPKVPVISTSSEFLLTTIKSENENPVYTNWLESLDADNYTYAVAGSNVATAYFDKTLLTYCNYEIIFWNKGLNRPIEEIHIQDEIKNLARNCFQYIVDEHPAFIIGKVVLQFDPVYKHIDIAFHESSSLTTITNSNVKHDLPIISSTFLLERYCEEELDKAYDGAKMKFVYDGNTIIENIINDSKFERMAARHVLTSADNIHTYRYFPNNQWNPFRYNSPEKKSKETIEEVILEGNRNRIDLLVGKIADDTKLLDELLDILNKKIITEEVNPDLFYQTHITKYEEDIDEECEINCTPEYIVDPYLAPETDIIEEEENKIPSGYLSNKIESRELKSHALEILCALPDRTLVRNTIFNGMKFGHIHYNLKDLPAHTNFDEQLISRFLNYYGLWEDFGNDAEIKSFLLSILNNIESTELAARLAYKYEQYTHSSIAAHIQRLIDAGLSYNTYVGEFTEIDLSTIPAEIFKPFESILLEKFKVYEQITEDYLKIEAEQQLPFYYALLNRLGHEYLPEVVEKKIVRAVKEHEQYGQLLEDDDEYEDENIFLVNMYREAKIKRLLEYYKNTTGPLWPLEEPLERFEESWKQTVSELLKQGTIQFGETFNQSYIERLTSHITLSELYEHDREFAYQLILYTYNQIHKKPAMASVVEPLILSIHKNETTLSKKLDIPALKDKNKYTLLQAAWNDLKNKDLDIAEQKAEAVWIMDPNMTQVWFLKARLLWLREGIPAYLAKEEYFINKVSQDAATLALIYNLSGCAMDIEQRYEEALSYFKKAASANPADSIYTANIAEINYKLGKPKDALKYAKAARANGSDLDIIKEIIENKGVLSKV